MIIIGLTGSIGMGKSVATSMLRDMGIPVHCSDEAVHALLGPKGGAVDLVDAAFPGVLNKKDRSIDRRALGQKIFGHDENRKKLEALIHPLVVESQARFIADHARLHTGIVVLDIPLLYETGAEQRVDKVIVVSAPAFIQRQRVLARPHMTEEKFTAILATQMPDIEKRRRADYIVETGIGMAATRRDLEKIITTLTKPDRKI